MHVTTVRAGDDEGGPGRGDVSNEVLGIILKLSQDLNPGLRYGRAVTLDSDLDRDIGLDSLTRAELVFRLDKAFNVRLPDKVLIEANTPRDLVASLKHALPRVGAATIPVRSRYVSLGRMEEPILAETLIEAMRFHVDQNAGRPHLKVWFSEDHQENIKYGDLHREALRIAYGLIDLGTKSGDRIAIMLPTSPDFFFAFFGVLYAGAIPVPIYPPFRPSQVEDHMRRQGGILKNAGAKILIMSEEIRTVGSLLYGLAGELRHIVTVADISGSGSLGDPMPANATSVALIQYTSGSTGDPKGVTLSHANLLANIRSMGEALRANSEDVFVSWLPLYHDMGLIGAWLGSLYYGAHAIIMPPLAFIAEPLRWLRVIHEHKATLSAGPNFAFELCCKSFRKAQVEGLNLSSLRLIVNGSEPVSAMTIERFTNTFRPYGFRPQMMGPVYGLAENAVGLAFPPLGRVPPIDRVKRDKLSKEGRAVPADEDDENVLSIVGCGQPIPHHQIRVVDVAGRELPERFEGRIQFRGPSATAGYFRNEEKTSKLFYEGWLETGDRGYLYKGDIHITGRIKDIIIKAGRNIYPQEIEELVGQIEGVRNGCVAAIASPDPRTGTESLVLVVETRIEDELAKEDLKNRIIEACSLGLDAMPDIVELVPPRTVPKTSSGKIRRAATRELYESRLLTLPHTGLWLQLLRLWVAGLGVRIKRFTIRLMEILYAGYWWGLLTLIAIVIWLGVIFLPTRSWRQILIRRGAQLFLLATWATPEVNAEAKLPESDCIVVVNHSSYIDSLVLLAVLNGKLIFVAKEELAGQKIAGPFLRRLGTIFVRRTSIAGGVEDTSAIVEAVRSGEKIVIFPEATLTRMPGLLPFRMGAFVTAVQTGKPIVPVVLRGTRTVLRGEQWFPRHGKIRVWLGDSVAAEGSDFNAAIALRDKVRAVMLKNSDEPDLSGEHIEINQAEVPGGKLL